MANRQHFRHSDLGTQSDAALGRSEDQGDASCSIILQKVNNGLANLPAKRHLIPYFLKILD